MGNNKTHTIIIGTSKSKNENGYYIESKKKFWSLIYSARITPRLLEPQEYQILTNKYGIGFAELAFDHVFVGNDETDQPIKNDYKLKDELQLLNESIPKLLAYLKKEKPDRIVFNGKTAAAGFYHFIKNGNVGKLDTGYIRELGFVYGKTGEWEGIEVWMLPNLSNAAGNEWKNENGEEKWLSFWKTLAGNTTKNKKSWVWVLVLLIITLITAILIFNSKK